jgi:hypothetical protein
VIDAWLEAGCPNAAPSSRSRHVKEKSPNTVANARSLLDTHVRPVLGGLRVDRTKRERVEQLFEAMARRGYATSTIDRTWGYLNQAVQYGKRQGRVRLNPAEEISGRRSGLRRAMSSCSSTPGAVRRSTRSSTCGRPRAKPTTTLCSRPVRAAGCAMWAVGAPARGFGYDAVTELWFDSLDHVADAASAIEAFFERRSAHTERRASFFLVTTVIHRLGRTRP